MMRPRYETEADREAARILAGRLSLVWNLDPPFETPPLLEYDFALRHRNSDRIAGFLEIKRRRYSSKDFEDYLVGMDKFISLSNLAKTTGIPTFLLFAFVDCAKIVQVGTPEIDRQVSFGVGGRKDRDDPFDFTIVARIPARLFKRPTDSNPFERE